MDSPLAASYHTRMESTTTTCDTTKAGEALIVKQLPRKRQNRVRFHGAGSNEKTIERICAEGLAAYLTFSDDLHAALRG
jgi:hypothetical protein